MLSSRWKGETLYVRLHHMFLDADPGVVKATARYVGRRDQRAGRLIDEYIRSHMHRVQSRPVKSRLREQGAVYDLRSIFEALNEEFFEGRLQVAITWGRSVRRHRRRRSMHFGTYCPERRLIRIHPALDSAEVPKFFVEFVVYHEMLHHIVPAAVSKGRHLFHTPQFRMLERRHPHYERAHQWEASHLDRLLRL